jgi:hypothetical protein
MIYKTISYGRTKNLGNYESERLDISIELEEMDDPVEKLDELRQLVMGQLYPERKNELQLLDEGMPD